MKEIVESYFRQRSLVNHQLASYNDCIPLGDGSLSRMEKIVRSIRIGEDEPIQDDEGGMIKLDVLDKEIIVRMKNIRLGKPTVREANGAEHPATPMETRIRKLTIFRCLQFGRQTTNHTTKKKVHRQTPNMAISGLHHKT